MFHLDGNCNSSFMCVLQDGEDHGHFVSPDNGLLFAGTDEKGEPMWLSDLAEIYDKDE